MSKNGELGIIFPNQIVAPIRMCLLRPIDSSDLSFPSTSMVMTDFPIESVLPPILIP